MTIAVVVPTYQRAYKLTRLLQSLAQQTFKDFDVYIYYDNHDYDTRQYIDIMKFPFSIDSTVNDSQKFVIGSWNDFFKRMFTELKDKNYQAVQWLVDDVALYPDFLEKAYNCLLTFFPDTDGVIGTRQECPSHSNYTFKYFGQSLLGRKFIERYKDVEYQVCCPQYLHFYQDEEMWMFANSLGKFINCPEALLKHYHPAYIREEIDPTHPIVRGEIASRDFNMYLRRKEKGLIWGKTFEKISQ